VDRLVIFRAPVVLGAGAVPAFDGAPAERAAAAGACRSSRRVGTAPTGRRFTRCATRRADRRRPGERPARTPPCTHSRPCSPDWSTTSAASKPSRRPTPGASSASGPATATLAEGESIACDGACLTVREFGPADDGADGSWFTVAAVVTTLGRTVLGEWEAGRRVNLERAMRAGDRLGGHLVQGHVDGRGHRAVGRAAGGRVAHRRRPAARPRRAHGAARLGHRSTA
jgi:hypothetical protein